MAKETIKCPKCGNEIEISQIIAQDLEAEIQKRYEKKMQEWRKDELERVKIQSNKEANEVFSKKIEQLTKELEEREKKILESKAFERKLVKREEELKTKELKLMKEYEVKEDERKKQFESEKQIIEEKANKRAEESIRLEMEDLKARLKERDEKLEKSERQELELRKIKRGLEEEKKNIELEMMRRLDQERQKIEEKVKRESEESHKLKDLEKDKQFEDMRIQIVELKRKAEQGSQKIQGEVMEIELGKILKDEFLFDEIEPVSSGIRGADIIQTVKTQSGRICGKILWESKRTKNWSDTWIQKLKDDQREAKADIAVIVSETLPKGFHHFRQIKDIWIADLPSTLSLALALRVMLIQVAKTQELQTGKEEKMEIVYNYLIGPEFRNRVQAIAEAFITMKNDLDTERRAIENIWAKREKQISRVVSNISGMRGDLEGIVGASLPSIKILKLPQGE